MENALFEFMYSTGCRIGEVVKLDRHDIDFPIWGHTDYKQQKPPFI